MLDRLKFKNNTVFAIFIVLIIVGICMALIFLPKDKKEEPGTKGRRCGAKPQKG